jgi:hypothetical protein
MAFWIDDIVLAPVYMTVWLGHKLKEVAESELTDEAKLRGELLDLQMRLEIEEISEEEYQEKERALLERLEWIARYKEAQNVHEQDAQE